MKLKLKSVETKIAQDGLVLTKNQLTALENAKADKEVHGEFESEYQGHRGAYDTFYIGTMKGAWRITHHCKIVEAGKESWRVKIRA